MSEPSSPVSLSGEIPSKSLGRIAESFADLVSPITETAGMLGDSIRAHREAAATRRVESVLKKAAAAKIELNPAPIKFIASWSDAASLEADGSDINDLWENLLLSALTRYDSYLNIFVDILRRFGGSEAKALKLIIDRAGPLDVTSISVPQSADNDEVPSYMMAGINPGSYPDDIWNSIRLEYDKLDNLSPNLFGAIIYTKREDEGEGKHYYYHPDFELYNLSFEFLKREGLIEFSKPSAIINVQTAEGAAVITRLSLLTGSLTQLGVSFSAACMRDSGDRMGPR